MLWSVTKGLGCASPNKDKNYTKDSFYEELNLEHEFDQHPIYHKEISNQQLWMRVYMKLVMIMRVRAVNFATWENNCQEYIPVS